MTIEISFKDHAFTPVTIECDHYDHNGDHRMFLIYSIKDSTLAMMIPDNAVNYIRTVSIDELTSFGTEDVNKEEKE